MKSSSLVRVSVVLGLLLAVLVGSGFRFYRLGELGLIADEGFQALAVEGVLDRGVPILENGAAYTRALPFVYMQSVCARVVGPGPLALRMPAAIFGVLMIPLGYLMGRVFLGPWVGLMLAWMIACSYWCVEMSRYGRFYTLFVCLYMAGLILFYLGYIRGRRSAMIGFFVVLILGMMIHDLTVTLAACFLLILPLEGYSWCRRLGYAGLSAICLIVAFASKKLMGVVADVVEGKGAIDGSLTAISSWSGPGFNGLDMGVTMDLWQRHSWFLGVMLGIAGVIGMRLIWRERGIDRWRTLLLVMAGVVGVCGQVGLGLVLAALYMVLWVRSVDQVKRPAVWAAFGVLGMSLVVWVVVLTLVDGQRWRLAVVSLFQFPAMGRYLIRFLLAGWPIFLALLLLGSILLVWRHGLEGRRCGPGWMIVGTLGGMIVGVSLVYWRYTEARYFFHLYPLMLLVLAYLSVAVGGRVVRAMKAPPRVAMGLFFLFILPCTLALAQDTNPWVTATIAQRDYGSHKDPIKSSLSWAPHAHFHQDHESIGRYVRDHRGPNDKVMVIGPAYVPPVMLYYAGPIDYVVWRKEYQDRLARDGNGRLREWFVGAELIHDPVRLADVLDHTGPGALWVITEKIMTEDDAWYIAPEIHAVLRGRREPVVLFSRDGNGYIFRIGAESTAPKRASDRQPGGSTRDSGESLFNE